MINEAITVSEFNSIINQTLSFAYPEVVVEGEVSSYKVNQGKWVFFDLKDEESVVGCFMPIFQLKTVVEDGMLIRVKAVPQLTKWGKFSLTVRDVELAGEGSVKKAFEMLKQKFEKEGLFAEERKRRLPDYPHSIILITSNQAAAFNDFVTIIQDRWAGIRIDHIQVQVQGQSAPEQISEAIEYSNSRKDSYDALVLIRGGGSAEDLQAFNNEDVVRAVFSSEIPTIVGIGHEDDVTLAELAADVRAATPTDAARRLVPDKQDLLTLLASRQSVNLGSIESIINRSRKNLEDFYHSIDFRINNLRRDFAELHMRSSGAIERMIELQNAKLGNCKKLLNSLDPSAVMARGYSIARVNGRVLKSLSAFDAAKDFVMLQLHEGQIELKASNNNGDDYDKEQTSLKF
jgi:exodeoxyribonuclease VII large subunit